MPVAPLNTICREFGCTNTKTHRSVYCVAHGGGVTEKGKENAKLYKKAVWQKIRARQLSKQPLCARCKQDGRIVAGEHIDHVFPHRRDEARFTVNMFQTLCASCHTLKTQDEKQGVYNHYTEHGVVLYRDDDYVRIIGMAHS